MEEITPSLWICWFCQWFFPCFLTHLVMTDFRMQTVESCPYRVPSKPNSTASSGTRWLLPLHAPGTDFQLSFPTCCCCWKICICFHILKVRSSEFFHRDFIFYCTKMSLAALLKEVRLFFMVSSKSTKDNGHIKKYIRNNVLTVRVIKQRKRPPREVVQPPSLEMHIHKTQLGTDLSHLL